MIGKILVDEFANEWKILGYQGDSLRVFNIKYNLLSEATGKTVDELIKDFRAIEEMDLKIQESEK